MRRVAAAAAAASSLLWIGERIARADDAACTAPTTHCDGDSGYYVPPDDKDKVEKQLDPLLKELRACLDAAGGKHVTPAIVIRFESDGTPAASRVDAGGYESLPCVASVQGKLVNARSVHATAMRCEYGCPKPKPPPPPTPVPLPPTTATTPAPAPAPTQQPPAPTPAPSPAPTKHTEKVWYGYQNLFIDAGAMAMSIVGLSTKTGVVTTVGIITYVFGSPTVHFVHGNVGPGFGSLGMRILLPPIGLAIGVVTGVIVGAHQSGNSIDNVSSAVGTGAIVGTLIGASIPIAIDAAAFGWEKTEVDGPPPKTSYKPTLRPQIGVGSVGVSGTF